MKHTPGPWEVGPEIDSGMPPHRHLVYINIFGKSRRLSSVSVYGEKRDGKTGGRVYKDGAGIMRHARSVSEDECRANATLIAAAPELYESLKYLMPYIEMYVDKGERPPNVHKAVIAAQQAIAKAEGRANSDI